MTTATPTPPRFIAYVAASALAAVVAVAVTEFPDSRAGVVLAVTAVALYVALACTRAAGIWALLFTYTFFGMIVSLPCTGTNSGTAVRLVAYAAQAALLLTPTVRHGIRPVVDSHREQDAHAGS